MKKIIARLFIGLLIALPFMLVTSVWTQASSADQPMNQTDLDCESCHPAFTHSWQTSAHGTAAEDPEFIANWQAQGEPTECLACHTTGYDARTRTWAEDGVTCAACHSPYPSSHPNQPMPTDRSAELCGSCHQETLFEWQVSKHRQAELDCVDCHGQHSTSLKGDDASALCANCHRDRSSSFAHTAHNEVGLTCADCHLAPLDGEAGSGHAFRDHSFNVKLSTCNECHAYQMHDPSAVHEGDTSSAVVEPDALAAIETAGVSLEPEPVSPMYFILLAALIGMAFGLLVAPWIERWYRRLMEIRVEQNDEK
ncbi:MAG TPA: hypothetical protein DEH25_05990 [Chloroflexi bacterium]|nr:hypothetical protein [Chloroflexota bacterium]HBY08553.1 hypothetical protein [Chloroflexota bacterium]